MTYPDFLGEIDFSRMFLGCDAPYGWVQGWGIEGGEGGGGGGGRAPWMGKALRKLRGFSTLKSLTFDYNIPSGACDETNLTSSFSKILPNFEFEVNFCVQFYYQSIFY